MKQVAFSTIVCMILVSQAVAQEIIPYTENGKAIEVRNTGNNLISELVKADSVFAFNIAVASFGPGKKLDWHIHPGGQVLVITEGTGYYQERGKPKLIVQKGEIIRCQPGVEHWHGASTESSVTYMATSPTQKGGTKWLEKVTDEQYNAKAFGTIKKP